MIKLLLTGLGFLLIGVGVIGTILPLIPGFPFLVAGAAILGKDHPIVRPFAELIARRRKSKSGRGAECNGAQKDGEAQRPANNLNKRLSGGK